MEFIKKMSEYFKISPYKSWRRDNRDEWLVYFKDAIRHHDSYDKAFKFLFETMNLKLAQFFIHRPEDDGSPIVYEVDYRLYYQNSDIIHTLSQYNCTGFVFDDYDIALKAQYELDKIRMWNLLKR